VAVHAQRHRQGTWQRGPPAAAQQGPLAQIKAKTPVLLANQW
jgi:hypothetical protein